MSLCYSVVDLDVFDQRLRPAASDVGYFWTLAWSAIGQSRDGVPNAGRGNWLGREEKTPWLDFVDTFRTRCLDPTTEIRETFEMLRNSWESA
jgi:hypothetical protein